MERIWICDDLERCQRFWLDSFCEDSFFRLWEIRHSFQEAFGRTPCFVVSEDQCGVRGLLPLSRIDETGELAFFPGETWHGRTWLEQNRIVANSPRTFRALLEAVPAAAHLRYLDGDCMPPLYDRADADELGYLFRPSQYGYSFQSYLDSIPRKSLKPLLREPQALSARGVTFRYNVLRDVDEIYRMNLAAFGENSYFHDERFLGGFERMIAELHRIDALRVTTVLVAGTVAAIDVGAIWNDAYTVLAGATNRDFLGVAKLINFHHLEVACRERLDCVDFLCGDFGWKHRFRLQPRPLYQIRLNSGSVCEPSEVICDAGILGHV